MKTTPKTKTADLITLMEYWAKTIAKNGGVAAVTIQEGADRLRELETELAALTAEREQLHTEVELLRAAQKISSDTDEATIKEVLSLRAEVERLKGLASWAHTCMHHNDEQRAKAKSCPVCATAERDQLRAEVEHYKFLHQCESDSSVAAFARAYRAEAECLEQARLLGMSGSREASLLSKISQLEHQVENYIYRYESML